MARSQAAQAKVEAFRNYLGGVAKKMADDLWGPKGPVWGTTLTEMEELALAAREVFTQKLLELGLERQATAVQEQRPGPAAACPSCQRPFAEAAAAASPPGWPSVLARQSQTTFPPGVSKVVASSCMTFLRLG